MGGIIPLKIPLVAFGIYVCRVRKQEIMGSSSIMEKVGWQEGFIAFELSLAGMKYLIATCPPR
jgi:hypothetical protein